MPPSLTTLKLKRTPGLYLVGFMASGKSTIGPSLAGQLGWPFVDLDSEIETHVGKTISEIFQERGEKAFRDVEIEILRKQVAQVESGLPRVLALGGGTFVQPMTWDLLRNKGVTLWLDCPLEMVFVRLGGSATRPLAVDRTKLAKLFEDRRPLYERADFRVEIDTDDVSAIVRKILRLPIF